MAPKQDPQDPQSAEETIVVSATKRDVNRIAVSTTAIGGALAVIAVAGTVLVRALKAQSTKKMVVATEEPAEVAAVRGKPGPRPKKTD